MRTRTAAAALLAAVVVAPAFAAPDPGEPAPAARRRGFRFGVGALVGSPSGELGRQIGTGGGVFGHATWAGAGGVLGLRVDGSFFLYGSETVRVPVSRSLSRISTEVTTDNWVGHLAAGPQVMARSGPVRPYANAFAGVSYFSTTSEAFDPILLAPIAESTNFDDHAFSYGAGAGFLVPLGAGRLSLDLGARYVRNGRVSYLAEGDIRDDGRGGIAFTPRRSRGEVVEFRVGVSFAP